MRLDAQTDRLRRGNFRKSCTWRLVRRSPRLLVHTRRRQRPLEGRCKRESVNICDRDRWTTRKSRKSLPPCPYLDNKFQWVSMGEKTKNEGTNERTRTNDPSKRISIQAPVTKVAGCLTTQSPPFAMHLTLPHWPQVGRRWTDWKHRNSIQSSFILNYYFVQRALKLSWRFVVTFNQQVTRGCKFAISSRSGGPSSFSTPTTRLPPSSTHWPTKCAFLHFLARALQAVWRINGSTDRRSDS